VLPEEHEVLAFQCGGEAIRVYPLASQNKLKKMAGVLSIAKSAQIL